jgi:hypothetical protein
MVTDTGIAGAAADAISTALKEGSLNRVIVNNDEYSMTYTGATRDGQNADEFAYVISMLDGSTSRVLKHKLSEVLRKRSPDGTPKFWVEGMPGTPPVPINGSLKCLLNAEHSNRKWIDDAGLLGRTCPKSNLKSEFDVENHMLHRHPQEARLIETALERERTAETRELARLQIEAMRAPQAARRGRPPKTEE